jgi:hypothetical protein
MNDLCKVIREMVIPNFLNIRTSIQTYDRDAVICGAPCWRWVSQADKYVDDGILFGRYRAGRVTK